MMGASHKAIGIACAAACVIAAIMHGDVQLAVASATTVVGAMLPDIDHNSSKIGRVRKKVFDKVKVILSTALVTFTSLIACMSIREGEVIKLLIGVCIALIIIGGCMLVTRVPTIAKYLKFQVKHRGIMHTLIPVVGIQVGAIVCTNDIVTALLFGLQVGYVSHLIADCLTVAGCPLLFPFTYKNISIVKVRTGTKLELVVLGLLVVGILLANSAIYFVWTVVR